MNPSNALFYSHLMQQFAVAARTQSRPPFGVGFGEHRSSKRQLKQENEHFVSFSSIHEPVDNQCDSVYCE
jgi:hypothetical protein